MFNEIILKLEKFTISYESSYHKSKTVRDFFVELVKNPFTYFFHGDDRLVVLDSIGFEIRRGDTVGILGTNGVGKTSLCRYLAGIIKSKEVKIIGKTRAIFENSATIFPDLTGRENVYVLTELLFPELNRKEKVVLMNEAIEFSEIKEFIDTPFKNYSRGMKVRIYLSLMTAKEVDLLVIDEAFGGVDQFFSEKLKKRMSNLISNCGAVVIVSHNLEEVRNYCNRVIVLYNKKVVFDGPAIEGIDFYSKIGLGESCNF